MPSARSRSVSVPVRVVTSTTPVVPPVSTIKPPARPLARPASKPKATPRPSFPRPTVDAIPEKTRRRIMWISVIVFALLMGGGTILISGQRDSNGSLAAFWSRVTSTFSGLKWPEKKASAAEQEIRALDAQVFPDFTQ